MNNLHLLKKRDSFYGPTLESLKKNRINFKKNLLLYEIAIKKKDLNQLKAKVKDYIVASINSYNFNSISSIQCHHSIPIVRVWKG